MEEIILFVFEVVFNTLWCFGLEKTEDKDKPLINFIAAFSLWGIFGGAVSFYFFRNQILPNEFLRIANLIITPAIVGGIMVLLLKKKIIKDKNEVYAFSKAFAFAFFACFIRYVSFKSKGTL